MHPLALPRLRAYLRDCTGYLGLAAATVPLGLVVQHLGWGRSRRLVVALTAVPPAVATLVAALREADGGTPGHRGQRLVVLDRRGEPPGLGRALLRNTAKIGLPWQLGHLVALGSAFGGFQQRDPGTLVPAVLVYPWFVVVAATVATGSGRSLHDRIAGTHVQALPGSAVPAPRAHQPPS